MTDDPLDDGPPLSQVHALTLVPFEFDDARENKSCTHAFSSFTVDAKERTLRCKRCGGEVDPYLAIEQIAHGWERWEATRKHCQERAKAAEQRLIDLERDERNCRARLADVRKKVMADAPEDLAEAIALLRSRNPYAKAWEQRRDELLAKHGGVA